MNIRNLAITTTLLIVFLAAGISPAFALTAGDVERFIKTYPQVEALFTDDELDDEGFEGFDEFPDLQTIKHQMLDALKQNRTAQGVVTKNGYRSLDQFADQAAQIMQAYMSLESSAGLKELCRKCPRNNEKPLATDLYFRQLKPSAVI